MVGFDVVKKAAAIAIAAGAQVLTLEDKDGSTVAVFPHFPNNGQISVSPTDALIVMYSGDRATLGTNMFAEQGLSTCGRMYSLVFRASLYYTESVVHQLMAMAQRELDRAEHTPSEDPIAKARAYAEAQFVPEPKKKIITEALDPSDPKQDGTAAYAQPHPVVIQALKVCVAAICNTPDSHGDLPRMRFLKTLYDDLTRLQHPNSR